VNRFSGANVSTIAIEVPIKRVTSDGKPASTTKHPVIGIYAETDRQKVRVLGEQGVESGGQGAFCASLAHGKPAGQ
jgi:Domain of unknown function (DUF4331)